MHLIITMSVHGITQRQVGDTEINRTSIRDLRLVKFVTIEQY